MAEDEEELEEPGAPVVAPALLTAGMLLLDDAENSCPPPC